MKINQQRSKGSALLTRLLGAVSALALAACSATLSRGEIEKPQQEPTPQTTPISGPSFVFNIPFLKLPETLWKNYVEVIPPESEMALDKISIDFNERSKMPRITYLTKSSVKLIQVETNNTGDAAEINSSGRISFPRKYHGESATDILDTTAQNIAHTEVQTRLLDAQYLFEIPSRTMQYATLKADIMSFSYVPRQYRKITLDRLRNNDPNVRAQNPVVKASIRSMFDRSGVITFAAAGNDSYRNASTLQWDSEFIVNFNDTHIPVGAAFVSKEGDILAASYTSATAPTVLSINPYEFGFSYHYYKDRADVEKVIDAEIDKVSEVPSPYSCRAKDKEAPWLKVIDEYEGEIYSQILTSSERATIKEALRNCYLSAYDSATSDTIYGTSFATPHLAGLAGGVLAKLRDQYGENALTPDELFAAIILSAQSVMQTEKKVKGSPLFLSYNRTPSGLFFNDNIAGFGYVDYAELESVAGQIAQSSAENPSLKPRQVNTTVTGLSYTDEITEDGFKRYRLSVQDDFTVSRIMAEFEFSGNPLERSDIIYLQAPSGEKIRVPLTREKNTDKFVFAFTNGMYGSSSKGEWSVLIPKDTTSVSTASLTFHGINKGSSIDQAIKRKIDSQMSENQDCKARWHKFSPMRFKIS